MHKQMEKYKTLSEPHKFWDTQPVKTIGHVEKEGEIKEGVLEEVQQEPYALPAGFTWCNMDLYDEAQLEELFIFLRENYVEDKDALFRFDY
jgi:glycylpeptide N-tetradecanoyltransferase